MDWSVDPALVLPFMVTALAIAMITMAVVTTPSAHHGRRLGAAGHAHHQPGDTGGWRRHDRRRPDVLVRLAIGPANAGLVAATGVASRVIAYPIAVIFMLAALQPAFTGILTIMPPSVMAAGLLFPAAFIMINGVQIISSRVLDARRTIVIGASILTFLLVTQFPETFNAAPGWVRPIAASPLILAALVALTLNLVFRIGIKRAVELSSRADTFRLEDVANFVERAARTWGARHDFVLRLKPAVMQAAETVSELCEPGESIRLVMSYDEFDIEMRFHYRGRQLELADFPPSHDEILGPGGDVRLAGFLIKRQADHVRTSTENGESILQLSFRQ